MTAADIIIFGLKHLLAILGILFLICMVFSYSPYSLYQIWWKRYRANAWLKYDNNDLIPVQLLARTENNTSVVTCDCHGNVRMEPIEKIVIPLDKEIVLKVARIQ